MSGTKIIRCGMSYVFDNFSRSGDINVGENINVLLHGIDIEFLDGAWCPVIPCAGPLVDLAVQFPDCREFRWRPADRKWILIV